MTRRTDAPSNHGVIGALVQLALAGVEAWRFQAHPRPGNRLLLSVAAGIGGIAAVICFSAAAYAVLINRVTPAEAWAVLGLFYSVAGSVVYLMASRRR